MSDYSTRNERVFNELEALTEKLGYGSLETTFEVHNRRVTGLTVYGKKRNIYKKDAQLQAVEDILTRIKSAKDQSDEKKQDTKLTFMLNVRGGEIKEVFWISEMSRNYEELDKTIDKS